MDGTTDSLVCERVALGLGRPALDAAADWLAERFGCDLGRVRIITPGARSQRLLLGELVDRAANRSVPLVPPAMLTPGGVLQGLAASVAGDDALAGPLTIRQAWRLAMAALPDDLRRELSRAPRAADHGLADALAASVQALAHNLIDFRSLERVSPRDDAIAWLVDDAMRRLAALGLHDALMLTLEAIGSGAAQDDSSGQRSPTVLLGVTELTPLERAALLATAAQRASLVVSDDLEGFDDLGLPRLDAWKDVAPLDVDLEIEFAGSPREQAEAGWSTLAALASDRSTDEVVMIAADASLEPEIARVGLERGQTVHRASGLRAEASAAGSFVRMVQDFRASRSAAAFADLLRHPWVDAWLCARSEVECEHWLSELDAAFSSRAVGDLDAFLASIGNSEFPELRAVRDAMAELLGSLDPLSDAAPAGFGPTADALAEVVSRVLDATPLDPRVPRDDACIVALRGLADARSESPTIDAMGTMESAEALQLLLESTAGVARADAAGPEAVEIIGWLESLLDPAPVAIALGLNEGVIPSAPGVDPFLPPALAQRLEPTRDRRLARDAYMLHALARTRALGVVCGRLDAQGEPLRPSRLLLRGSRLLERTLQATREAPSLPPSQRADATGFGRWLAKPAPVTSMRVTAFADYINSPRLFYLTHILGLSEEGGEEALQLEAGGFGSLVHDVLKLFGLGEKKHSPDARAIRSWLDDALSTFAREQFGSQPRIAVKVQIEIARRRLAWLAEAQAQWRQEGWHILHAEHDVKDGVLDVDGEPMGLRGRIDRIDQHEDGRIAVLDYKTSANAQTPEQAHRRTRDKVWVDLQLPLYRHLLRRADERMALGYINLGRDVASSGFHLASWSGEDLESADETAREIVRAIRRGEFDEIGNGAYDEDSASAWAIGTPDVSAGEGDER